MTKNYLFAPIIILIILIASIFGGYSYGQNSSEPVKKIEIKKEVKTDGDSVIVIVKTIEKNEEEIIDIDSILSQALLNRHDKEHKLVQIINGDTIITNCWSDSLAHIWVEKFETDQFAEFEAEIESHMEFLRDSCSQFSFSFEFDSLTDPLQMMHSAFIFDENHNPLMIEKFIDAENLGDSIEKQVRLIIGDMHREMVAIEDFDHNNIIHKQQRILLDDLSEEDKKKLGDKGLKLSNKEPEFKYFKLYPNPSDEAVTLNFKLAETGDIDVRVMNMLGQVVYEEKIKNLEEAYDQRISLGHKEGTYVLQIIQDNKVISRKIMIEK